MKTLLTCTNSGNKRKSNTHSGHKSRFGVIFVVLIVLLLLLLLLNVSLGSVMIPFSKIPSLLSRTGQDPTLESIIWSIRLPRALAALILGGGLALSGYLLQTFFHNPIAGPFVLGISSGAKLAVSLIMVFLLGSAIPITSLTLIGAAFVGAMISMGFVLLIARKINRMSMLIISGVMIGYICSAITDFVVTFAADSDIVNLHNWSMGSFSGISWSNVGVMTVVVISAGFLVFLLSKPISAYQMGESYAKNMGVNIGRFRMWLVLLSSLLAACVTAFAGPVSFVGIAVPQIIKQTFHTSKPILMIPACFLGGGVFCLFADLIARLLFAPTELSISTVTAILGAPVVIIVLLRQEQRKER